MPAPKDFSTTGKAVWNGQRTLAGVWVSHPLARKARPVRILNTETNRSIDGLLLRQGASALGGNLLISADAAAAIGMTPAIPSEISIVALNPPEPDTARQAAPQPTVVGTQTETAPEGTIALRVHVGNRISIAREEKGISQKDLANSLEMDLEELVLIEAAGGSISLGIVENAAIALDKPVEYFFNGYIGYRTINQ